MSNALHIPGAAVAVVIDLPFLASEINDAHRQVIFHGKSMLLEARRAGEHLLKAKERVRHGEFKAWIKRNCDAPYDTVVQYMRVAKAAAAKNVDLHSFDGGIRAFLDACATPRAKTPEVSPTFDRADAEHAMKLHALFERGSTEAERDVAWNKLNAYAKGFGMVPEDMVAKAQDLLPGAGKTTYQAEAEAYKAEVAALRTQLEAILTRTDELRGQYTKLPKDELVEMCIGMTLEREGFAEVKKAA